MEDIKKKMTEAEALEKLSAVCARSEHCVSDMRRRMRLWDMTDEEKQRVIKTLIKEDFINENRYAKAFVREKFCFNHWGLMKIEMELKRKGIKEHDIEAALTEVSQEESLEELRRLIREKNKSVTGKSDFEIRAKLYRFALSRGFSGEQINEVLDDME